MIFRAARAADIPQIQIVRNSVKENMLSNPSLVTDEDCLDFIANRGKGWVCEIGDDIVGFSIADLVEENVWALFVHPAHTQKGIGKQLQKLMLDWYFATGKEKIWLGTAPNTRAAAFYLKTGWTENGTNGTKEIRFELTSKQYHSKM